MIIVKELKTKKEMKQFVTFPFSLYKKNKYWIPPMINDELASFDKTKNPVFENANAQFFLAYKNKKPVGRIVAIINNAEVINQGIKKMRFGWFDFIDDYEVSKILLDKIHEIGLLNKLDFIEGPVGFSSMDKVGVLSKGFNFIGKMITWYNDPYYINHYKRQGYKVEKEYLEYEIKIKNIGIDKYAKYADLLAKRYQLKPLNFSSAKEIMPYVDEMFELYHKSYSKLSSYVPLSQSQIDYFKEKYIPFINPEFIKFVVDKNNKLVSFSILMPSFAKAIKKANGKLLPFGFIHLLKAKKKIDTVVSYLIGIAPEYQNKGIIAIIFNEFYNTVTQKKVETMLLTPQLKDNEEIHKIWRNFKPEITHERMTFKLAIKK